MALILLRPCVPAYAVPGESHSGVSRLGMERYGAGPCVSTREKPSDSVSGSRTAGLRPRNATLRAQTAGHRGRSRGPLTVQEA